jgi:hypothetical protein
MARGKKRMKEKALKKGLKRKETVESEGSEMRSLEGKMASLRRSLTEFLGFLMEKIQRILAEFQGKTGKSSKMSIFSVVASY